MGERVRVESACGAWVVLLDGEEKCRSASLSAADYVADGIKIGLEAAAEADIVADTARALDGTRDTPEGGYQPGDRVRLDGKGFGGYIEGPADCGFFWVRVPFGVGDGRYYVSPSEMTFLGRDADEPEGDDAPDEPAPFPFKVGDRVVDDDGDAATVKVVRDDGTMDVLYDDRDWGICGEVRHQYPDRFSFLPPARPSVTPHPDRPDTADGELPEGWREDCYGNVFGPGEAMVKYVPEWGHWYVSDRQPDLGPLTYYAHPGSGPRYFYRRSEAIARLRELLAEGGDR